MSQPLWMSIEPRPNEVRVSLYEPGRGSVLRARLPLYQKPGFSLRRPRTQS